MKTKIFGIILFIFLITQNAFAQTIAVKALEDFSTENPSATLSLQALESFCVNDETVVFKSGDIIYGKIVDVKVPKRLKRNATFTFLPYELVSGGIHTDITGQFKAKYTTLVDKKDVAKHAALGVGNYFVKGLSMGYSAIEGAVKNEKDNRFKSSVNALYEDSPLSFVEKGEDIVITKDQTFFLKFKTQKDEELTKDEDPENE